MQTQISTAELNDCLPALHRFALQLTRNQDRACDLVQDSVERALRKAHLFDGSNLRSWLFTICRRVFLNQIRSEKARGVAVEMDDAPQSRLSSAQTQEQTMHFNDVVDAFQKLPVNDRVILSLVVIEGMKYEEAAEMLDVPVGTVRSRLSRARNRLMTMTEGENEAEEGTNLAAVV
ncbi:RNA polymerase sigma factor [Hyphococcus luteus]|uniref:RNA polymerase subunit sigma-24 n=1 Tax=Hyphococcus luteus TaxID=2058213 RepID=A0A2S7KA64_9PROT|nr:RNA polymerase sigma factor [Marinicaulis flavus]PQA89368.1 RNA polymerase subunit sigma-24 [Marinicaulis flavus]